MYKENLFTFQKNKYGFDKDIARHPRKNNDLGHNRKRCQTRDNQRIGPSVNRCKHYNRREKGNGRLDEGLTCLTAISIHVYSVGGNNNEIHLLHPNHAFPPWPLNSITNHHAHAALPIYPNRLSTDRRPK